MHTKYVDRSFCLGTLKKGAREADIKKYLKKLADPESPEDRRNIKFAELDFRTLMKVKGLPSEMRYIFRLVDPNFLPVTRAFEFDYMLLTLSDLKNDIKTRVPIMLEIPYIEKAYKDMIKYAQMRTRGAVTAVRFYDEFGFMDKNEVKRLYANIRKNITLPVDFCPKDNLKSAVDFVIKLQFEHPDSISMAMPRRNSCASLLDYAMACVMVYNLNPFDVFNLFNIIPYYDEIFEIPVSDCFDELFRTYQADRLHLKNANEGIKTFDPIIIRSIPEDDFFPQNANLPRMKPNFGKNKKTLSEVWDYCNIINQRAKKMLRKNKKEIQ